MNGWLTPMGDITEAPDHVCGKCRTPWGLTNPACPNRPPAPSPHINILAAPLDATFTDEESAAVITEWMNE